MVRENTSPNQYEDTPTAAYGDHPEPSGPLNGVARFPATHNPEAAVGEEKHPDGGNDLHIPVQCADEGMAAFHKMYDLKEIASPRFARLIGLAREEGLLAPLLAGDSETVEKVAAALREELSEIVRSHCRISQIHTQRRQARDHPAAEPSPV